MIARNIAALLALILFLVSSATAELGDQVCSVNPKDTTPGKKILSEGQDLYMVNRETHQYFLVGSTPSLLMQVKTFP